MTVWNERLIARAIARQTFASKYLVLLPNCNWTGSECDLLAVTDNLRLIDIEIKISVADLKADANKTKWYHNWDYKIDGPYVHGYKRRPRLWPTKVWKHYYCVPESLWKPELELVLASAASGVICVSGDDPRGYFVRVAKKAKPCADAKPISDRAAIDLARLASLRMWDAYFESTPQQLSVA